MAETFAFVGKVAIVTGAASGIGRAIAIALAGRGCHLALADINEAGLAETASLAGGGIRTTLHRLDVADRRAIAALPDDIAAAHGGAAILVNNAGVALGGTFAQISEQDFDWLIDVNFKGVVRLTRAFLPMLRANQQAQLVNISSIYGLIAPPGQSAYCASKFAVRGFSESLRKELLAENAPVRVTVVHPGGVRTNIAKSARIATSISEAERERGSARIERALRMPPERAGKIIVEAIARRQARVLVGADAKIASLIERVMPVSYWSLIGR